VRTCTRTRLGLRLFELRDGCYYFVGIERLGYGTDVQLLGAHPILDSMLRVVLHDRPHTHLWRPWSPNFALVGSWYYWEGL